MSIIHKLSTGMGGRMGEQDAMGMGGGLGGEWGNAVPVSPPIPPVEGGMGGSKPRFAEPGPRSGGGMGGRMEGSGHPPYSQTYPLPIGGNGGMRGNLHAHNPHTPDGLPTTPAWVQHMLEEAGATLLALPSTGHSTHLRQGGLEWVRDAAVLLAPGSGPAPARPPAPHPAAIDRMDRVLAWLSLIPDGKFVLRRIAGARALVHPLTGRHLYPWRRLGTALGADHKAVQRWHAQAMQAISDALNRVR